jgi:hypothetical protein
MTKSPAPSTNAAPTALALFGPPPLLEGESSTAYDELLARISGTVKPADVLEEIWVSDIVNLTWEIAQFHRLKANLITASTYLGVRAVLSPIQSELGEAHSLAYAWAARMPDAVKKVKELLASAGLSMDAVMALTFAEKITEIERFDRLAMNAEIRRNAALREIERHRARFSQALRRASDGYVDAQLEPVVALPIEDQKAA